MLFLRFSPLIVFPIGTYPFIFTEPVDITVREYDSLFQVYTGVDPSVAVGRMSFMNLSDQFQIFFSLKLSFTWIPLPFLPLIVAGAVDVHQFAEIRDGISLFESVDYFVFAPKVVMYSF